MAARNQTERQGINAVEKIFLDSAWLFRDQPVSDWGIDAHAEPTTNDIPTGQLTALQIKTGKSYLRKKGNGYVYYGKKRHLDYWLRHSLPVYIIIHDPTSKLTIWQKIEEHLVKVRDKGRWTIDIPKGNILNKTAISRIKHNEPSDSNSFRRYQMALDYAIMGKFVEKKAYMSVLEMYTKSLNMRGASFYFQKKNKSKPDLEISRWMPHSDIHKYMSELFPWLDYKHVKPLLYPNGDVEGEVHELEVWLNHIGLSFIALEEFYKSGPSVKDYEIPYDDSDELDEDEQMEADYQRAIAKD